MLSILAEILALISPSQKTRTEPNIQEKHPRNIGQVVSDTNRAGGYSSVG